MLGEAGVIDNPVQHRPVPLDRRQHLRPHRGQDRCIVPRRLGHHVVQRLMFGLHMGGVEPRCHRLDALALAGQQQAGAIGARRGRAAGMPQHSGNRIQISRQPRFAAQRLSCFFLIHHPDMGWLETNDTVRIGQSRTRKMCVLARGIPSSLAIGKCVASSCQATRKQADGRC